MAAEMIRIENHGPLIRATNYWESELASSGKFWVSVNAGAVRILVPQSRYADLADMRAAKECVLSRGPDDAIEIMFDDGSDQPYALHLTPTSFDLLPTAPEPGREWLLTVWLAKDGQPHKALERVCHWRRSARIPDLRPWRTI